jgi:hypothetical protein
MEHTHATFLAHAQALFTPTPCRFRPPTVETMAIFLTHDVRCRLLTVVVGANGAPFDAPVAPANTQKWLPGCCFATKLPLDHKAKEEYKTMRVTMRFKKQILEAIPQILAVALADDLRFTNVTCLKCSHFADTRCHSSKTI